jgi:hypothetical protein
MSRFFLSLLLLFSIFNLAGQERIQQGKMYSGGDHVYAPLTGTSMVIPEHWRGYGTQETEMLTLSSDTSNATLRIFSVQDNLVSIKNRLKGRFEIAPGVAIIPIGEATFTDNILSTELTMSNDKNISGYLFVKCGRYGNCVGFLFGSQTKTHELYYDELNKVLHQVELSEPKIVEPGGDYNWANELNGKHLFHYESSRSGTLGNQLWLCSDGTFTANLKRKGMFNKGNQRKIRGNHSGKYKFEGIGKEGVLILNFDKMDGYEMVLKGTWEDNEIYFNGVKYYRAVHQKCD